MNSQAEEWADSLVKEYGMCGWVWESRQKRKQLIKIAKNMRSANKYRIAAKVFFYQYSDLTEKSSFSSFTCLSTVKYFCNKIKAMLKIKF